MQNCNVSLNKTVLSPSIVHIGAKGICPWCGCYHDNEDYLYCDAHEYKYNDGEEPQEPVAYCESCNDAIYEDDDYIHTEEGYDYCCATCARNEGFEYCRNISAWTSNFEWDNNRDIAISIDGEYVHSEMDDRYWEDEYDANEDGYYYVYNIDDYVYEDFIRTDNETGEQFYFDEDENIFIRTDDGTLYFIDEDNAEAYGCVLNENGEWTLAA